MKKNLKVNLDTKLRTQLVARILDCLEAAAPRSRAKLRGSLAREDADQYSDIDVLWEVPSFHFNPCLDGLEGILSRVSHVESLRIDPSMQGREKYQLAFVRFEGVSLFWRLDLEIVAQSIDTGFRSKPEILKVAAPEWSPTESALMNAVAAAKALFRGNNSEAKQLLLRGYKRVGLRPPILEPTDLILRLADSIKAMDPSSCSLAERVKQLVLESDQ